MDAPLFIKCEPECSSDMEKSPDLEPNLQLPPDNLVEVEVEPDHSFYCSDIEETNSELIKKKEEEDGHENCDTSATLIKNFVDEATTREILQGQDCNDAGVMYSPSLPQDIPWICLICKRSFKNESSLKVHTYVSCQTATSSSAVDDIGKKTGSLNKFSKTHADVPLIHTSDTIGDERPCFCQICGKKFSGSSCLSRHKVLHTGGKPHACTLCDKQFALKSNLRAHILTHTSYKPHSCITCGKAFLTKPNLRRHILTHTGQKFHSCSTCGKAFALRSNMKTHLLTHTGRKPFSCNLCGKEFAHRSNLKTHMFTHSDQRPHICPTCGKSFTLKAHLNVHVLIHTDRSKYSCNTCGMNFPKKILLVKHVATHLNGDGC